MVGSGTEQRGRGHSLQRPWSHEKKGYNLVTGGQLMVGDRMMTICHPVLVFDFSDLYHDHIDLRHVIYVSDPNIRNNFGLRYQDDTLYASV